MTDLALHQGFAGCEAQKCQSAVNLLTDYHNTLKIPAESQGFQNEKIRTLRPFLKLTGMHDHADLPERDTKLEWQLPLWLNLWKMLNPGCASFVEARHTTFKILRFP